MEIYHGSTQIVSMPEIRVSHFNKDFYFGFYCTYMKEQAIRWATRFGNGYVNIFYSLDHVRRSFADNDTARVDFETRGVLLHELTHAFQLEPQGIGPYGGPNKAVWEMVEGTADAVRVTCGGFHGEPDRPKGGSYHDGYRYVGYFFNWVKENKDKDFIRKMNHSCLTVVPWSWDGAVQYVLGADYTIDTLWHEYQLAVGDVQE